MPKKQEKNKITETRKQEISKGVQYRILDLDIESRAVEGENQDKNTLVGYASVFDIETQIGSYFREKIEKGAFARAISDGHDVRALIDHDPSKILGRTKANTLKLSEDNIGLKVEIDLPKTHLAHDIRESVARGDVNQMSIGFVVKEEKWDYEPDVPLRTISDVDLFDVSVVTYPAFEDTEVSLRSAIKAFEEIEKPKPLKKGFPQFRRAKLNLLSRARRHNK